MQLQYFKDLNDQQKHLIFDPVESRHIIKVLRHNVGDTMYVTNGNGLLVQGKIITADPKYCELEIVSSEQHNKPRNYFLQVCIAPTKNIDRIEWFLEKVTEIGVDRITPILCERSERKIIKHERLQKIIVSAMKQSGQLYLPVFDDLLRYTEIIDTPFDGNRLIAHCLPNEKQSLKSSLNPIKNIQILIGPEGDFTENEIELALKQGIKPITLGDTRLRTETAGIVAAHTVCLHNSE